MPGEKKRDEFFEPTRFKRGSICAAARLVRKAKKKEGGNDKFSAWNRGSESSSKLSSNKWERGERQCLTG